jgi:integrase
VGKVDKRFLERHGQQWRVVVPVPRNLQQKLGKTKLKKSLKTDSLMIANRLKGEVVRELQSQIYAAEHGDLNDPIVQEALRLREILAGEWRPKVKEDIRDGIIEKAEDIQGQPLKQDMITGEYIFDPQREQRADLFFQIATGEGTPLTLLVAQYHSQVVLKERTKGDGERALRYLQEWCQAKGVRPTVETLTRKMAGRFIADLPSISASGKTGQGLTNKTVNKYISTLSSYWRWLKSRGYVDENIWTEQSLPKMSPEAKEQERAFTDEEVRTLMSGSPRPALGAIMRIGALSGARIDAIVSLNVGDCQNGMFRFKAQKKEKGPRFVPIHSTLEPLISELTEGKGPDEPLFPEYPPPRQGAQQEQSMPAVKAFGYYRKKMGVDESRPGKRRGLVNFHSFRRWFITKAEQAGQDPHIIAAVVGHKREGMTLGLYSAGPSQDQFRACVEAVKLPYLSSG